MGKFSLPKKALRKSEALISILHHDDNIDVEKLIEQLLSENCKVLLILDGLKKINLNKNKNLTVISLSKRGISKSRNFSIKFAIKNKFKLLLFLDSDCHPNKNILDYHLKKHNEYNNVEVIGGSVNASFLKKKVSLITKIDGMMSWFGALDLNCDYNVKFPYHIPTLNMSIKLKFLEKKKIKFSENLETGEDYQFCKDVKKVSGKIKRIKNAMVNHEDRKNFSEVIKHQSNWGRHQYYTLYLPKNVNKKIFNILFLIFFPPLIPLISIVFSLITIFPWCKKNLLFFKYIFVIYLLINIKCFYSYMESFKNFKKQF